VANRKQFLVGRDPRRQLPNFAGSRLYPNATAVLVVGGVAPGGRLVDPAAELAGISGGPVRRVLDETITRVRWDEFFSFPCEGSTGGTGRGYQLDYSTAPSIQPETCLKDVTKFRVQVAAQPAGCKRVPVNSKPTASLIK
jgi:hypothetical protein